MANNYIRHFFRMGRGEASKSEEGGEVVGGGSILMQNQTIKKVFTKFV